VGQSETEELSNYFYITSFFNKVNQQVYYLQYIGFICKHM
jgi:hypothetical protein